MQQGGDVSNMVARRAASLGAGVGLPDMSLSRQDVLFSCLNMGELTPFGGFNVGMMMMMMMMMM